jgi:hypothetical protein
MTIALAALAYRLDGEENLARGRKIQEAILLSPTLFPLAFAALGGRSLKKIALWRAQEGTTLGVSTPRLLHAIVQGERLDMRYQDLRQYGPLSRTN